MLSISTKSHKIPSYTKEIAQIGIYHLETAPDAIISFGQGCEGEPSLAVDNIVPAIEKSAKNRQRSNQYKY